MRHNKGVTLVELLIVIVILGIIAAIAVPAVGRIVENTRWRSVEANLMRLEGSVRLYRVSGDAFVDNDQDLMGENFDEADIPERDDPEYWEMYSMLLLGDYVDEWPTLPNSGRFSYRYRDIDGMENTSQRLFKITLEHLDGTSTDYDETNLEEVFFNDDPIPNEGHFLKIRFDGSSEGDADFEQTARFLLENTDYQQIFRWIVPHQSPQNNIWIYIP